MNILMAIDIFSFSPAGGAGTVLFQIGRSFVRRGHRVDVICQRRTDLGEDSTVDGVRFLTYALDRKGWPVGRFFDGVEGYRSCLRRRLNEGPVDVVNSHHPWPGWALRSEAGLERAARVVTWHSPWDEEHITRRGPSLWGGGVRRWLDRRVLDAAHRVITLSAYMKAKVAGRSPGAGGRTEIIPGGVDPVVFRPAETGARSALRERLGWSPDTVVLLTVRSLIPRTGVRELMEAFEILAPDWPQARLVIGGTGPLEKEIRERAASRGFSGRVRLLGFLESRLLPEHYGAADFSVVPTQDLEGFGLVVVESLACGTPVLATPVGGLGEALNPLAPEFLLPGKSPAEMARGILAWKDRVGAARSRAAALRSKLVELHGWDVLAARWERVFEEAGADRGRA